MKSISNYLTGAIVALVCLAIGDVAFAQAATTTPNTVVDLSPYLNQLAVAVVPVITAVAVWVLTRVATYLKSKTGLDLMAQESLLRGYLEKALQAGVDYALAKSKDAEWAKIDTRNALIATAAEYVLKSVPDALAYFKLDEAGLRDRLIARLPKDVQTAASWK